MFQKKVDSIPLARIYRQINSKIGCVVVEDNSGEKYVVLAAHDARKLRSLCTTGLNRSGVRSVYKRLFSANSISRSKKVVPENLSVLFPIDPSGSLQPVLITIDGIEKAALVDLEAFALFEAFAWCKRSALSEFFAWRSAV